MWGPSVEVDVIDREPFVVRVNSPNFGSLLGLFNKIMITEERNYKNVITVR